MRLFFPALVSLSLALVLGSIVSAGVPACTFTRSLTVGSRGADVSCLQTLVGATADGKFGPLTKAAVADWQAANGIAPAVGYFGPISQAAFAAETAATAPVVSSEPTPPLTTPVPSSFSLRIESDALAALGMRANRVMLFRALPFEVRPGDSVTLDGSGFSKTLNEVYFDGDHRVTVTSTDGITLKIFVPANLSEGEYMLSVSNKSGSSDNPDIDVVIKVTNNPQPAPTIESASIAGDTVTLVGRGFTSANNLFTTLGDSSGPISSNGTTLTFRVTALSRYNQIKQFTKGEYQAALWIYVQNEHGINKEPYKLEIII